MAAPTQPYHWAVLEISVGSHTAAPVIPPLVSALKAILDAARGAGMSATLKFDGYEVEL